MNLLKIFIFLITAMFIFNTIHADYQFFFKGGGGLGYDSNVLSSVYNYQSAYFNVSMAGQYEYKADSFSIFAMANADSDIYDVFLYLNTGLSAGAFFSLDPGNLFKIQGNYIYIMDIKQLFGCLAEVSQDIGDFSTIKAGYEFNDSIGAPGVTDEQFISHSAWLGLNLDLGSIGYADIRIQDSYFDYPLIMISGNGLKHNGLTGGIKFTLIPDTMFEFVFGGKYAYHDSFVTNLTVFSDTNDISLYNSSSVYEAIIELNINWTDAFMTGLSFLYGYTALLHQPITESVYITKLSLEYYFSESLKFELPLTYNMKSSSIGGNIDRWKIEGNIYYMF